MRIYKHTVEDGYVEVTTLWKCKEILAMTTWGRVVLVPCELVDQEVELLSVLEGGQRRGSTGDRARYIGDRMAREAMEDGWNKQIVGLECWNWR